MLVTFVELVGAEEEGTGAGDFTCLGLNGPRQDSNLQEVKIRFLGV